MAHLLTNKITSVADDSPGLRRADHDEPLAIVGIGCRFPGGVNGPASLWKLLLSGTSAIGPVPPDRWDAEAIYDTRRDSPGKTWAREGGFLEHIDRMDAHFFGLSPREAAALDPQTRLLMEVAYEAFEDAGQDPVRRAQATGVFIGISGSDYQDLQLSDRRAIDGYVATGTALSSAANRISHALDQHGPSISVDTACSSSLVAVHLAAQSIRTGESELALAGGVGLLLCPEMTIAFSKGFLLAPDMRCKAFDARANGFVRGEGAGIVILKRLSHAVAEGDRIYAVLLATAVNQDGFTEQGIAVPNQRAQEAQLEIAYRRAGVHAHEVHYVEAHGPGTPVGDPIEAGALGTVLGRGRSKGNELVLGSIKTNIGHLEPAAGIAGLIKTALVLHHGAIPPTLHFETPNPAIPFDDLGLRVATRVEPWQPDGSRRVAGVNSFGFGGTNAHAVLAGAESHASPGQPAPAPAQAPWVLALSAASRAALAELVEAYEARLAAEPDQVVDIVRGAALRRTHHAHRMAILGEDAAALRAALPGWQERVSQAQGPRRLAFVFSGMGGQWWGMGRELYDREPVFRQVIDELDAMIHAHAGWSLVDELMAPKERNRLTDDFAVGQPAMFALQVALTALWRSLGVEPEAIVGHSVGEIAAAHVAGAIGLDEAVALVLTRSELQARAAGQGAMVAVPLAREHVLPYLDARVSVAVVNSPESTVLAGDRETLEAIVARLETRGAVPRWLAVPFAAHSPLMEEAKEGLVARMQSLAPASPVVPLYSTVTGVRVEGAALDARYWGENTRAPVLFVDAVRSMLADGIDVFIEIGPHPVLVNAIAEYAAYSRKNVVALPSMRRDQPARMLMREALGRAWSLGCSVDWQRAYGLGPFVDLPRYPWQHQSFWREPEAARRARHPRLEHPLLGAREPGPLPAWSGDLGRAELAYLEDHNVQGAVIFPAAGFVEMALAAGNLALGGARTADGCVAGQRATAGAAAGGLLYLERVRLLAALFIDTQGPVEVRTIVHVGEQPRVEIYSQRARGEDWTLHCRVDLTRARARTPEPVDVDALRQRCSHAMEGEAFYDKLTRMGDRFGQRFKGVRRLWRGHDEALAEIELAPEIAGELARYHAHPVAVDALFQSLVGNFELWEEASCLPIAIERLVVHAPLQAGRFLAHARIVDRDANGCTGELCLLDAQGRVLVEASGFTFCMLESLGARHARRLELLWQDVWEAEALPACTTASGGAWLVLAGRQGPGLLLAEVLRMHGHHAVVLPMDHEDLDAAVSMAGRADGLRGVVFASAAGAAVDIDAVEQETAAAVRLVQALARDAHARRARLWWVTQGVHGAAVSPGGATLWGLARVVANEHPELRSTLIDMDGSTESIEALARELLADGHADEIKLTREGRHVHRLQRMEHVPCSQASPMREVCVEHLGAATNVTVLARPLPPPGPGQVVVAIGSVALGPWDARSLARGQGTHPLGHVAAGVIVSVGAQVRGRTTGEYVLAVGHGLLATHAVVDAGLVVPVDARLDAHAWSAAALSELRTRLASFDLPERIETDAAGVARLLGEVTANVPLDAPSPAPISLDELEATLLSSSAAPVVLSPEHLAHDAVAPLRLRDDATYLIAGGLGGFGLMVAEWLVASGARHLVLCSRRGAATPEARAAIQRLEGRGAHVTVERVDVTDQSGLARVIASVQETSLPLRGVIHSAMVLEDSIIARLERATLERVMAPKVRGAWNLHELTAELPLDFFVLFSSFASMVGNSGQAAYAAANAFLDGLARARRARHMTGLSIGWGILDGVGYVAERAYVRVHLERIGLSPIPLHASLGTLSDLVQSDVASATACHVNWRRWCGAHASGNRPRLASLGRVHSSMNSPLTWEQMLREAPAVDRLGHLVAGLTERVARILGMTPDALEPGTSLTELGMDSLMAVELRNRLRQDLGLDLPTLTFLRGPTLLELAELIGGQMFAGRGGDSNARSAAPPAPTEQAWVMRSAAGAAAPLRLFCFPYNGGRVSTYAGWAAELPGIDVVALKLPGWLDRPDEAPVVSWDHLVEQIVEVMAPQLDRPYALYGHSLGALLAFEVARRLETLGYRPSSHLFLGAFAAPMLPSPFPTDIHQLLDLSIDRLGMAEVLAPALEDPELMRDIVGAVRSGVALLDSYRFDGSPTLTCPVVGLCGDRDSLVGPEHVAAWAPLTTGAFRVERVQGGHLFVDEARAATLDLIRSCLAPICVKNRTPREDILEKAS